MTKKERHPEKENEHPSKLEPLQEFFFGGKEPIFGENIREAIQTTRKWLEWRKSSREQEQ